MYLLKLDQVVFNRSLTYPDLRGQLSNGRTWAFQKELYDLVFGCTQPNAHSWSKPVVPAFPQNEWGRWRLMIVFLLRFQRNDRFEHVSFDELRYCPR